MSKSHVIRHVRRLLSGERDPRSLDALFNWLRFHSNGLRTVKEVGDLIAHSFHKDTGLAWESLARIWTMAEYHLLPLEAPERATPRTVERLRATTLAAFQSQSDDKIRQATGMAKPKAEKLLNAGLAKIDCVDDNRIQGPLTQKEGELVLKYCNTLVSAPAFDDERLISELAEACRRNGFIDGENVGMIRSLREFVAVYCIEKMHLALVTGAAGTDFQLRAGITNPPVDWTLHVYASFPLSDAKGGIQFSFPAFITSCDAREHCNEILLTTVNAWDLPLELDPDGKLRPF